MTAFGGTFLDAATFSKATTRFAWMVSLGRFRNCCTAGHIYTTDAITDFALEFLDDVSKSERPFLLYVAFNAPHYPLQAPEVDVNKYDGRFDKGWDELRKSRHAKQIAMGLLPALWRLSPRAKHTPAWNALTETEQSWEADRMEVFAAMVDILDRNVGRIVDYLADEEICWTIRSSYSAAITVVAPLNVRAVGTRNHGIPNRIGHTTRVGLR